jgi:hypothetical protein
VPFSFTHHFETELLTRLRKTFLLLLSAFVTWALCGGPQPLTDGLLRSWSPESSGKGSLLVQLPRDTSAAYQREIVADLKIQGATWVIPLGAKSPLGADKTAWAAADPFWAELGVLQAWNGSVRGLSTRFETLPGRIQAARMTNPKSQRLSLPLGAGPPPRVHLKQLAALGPDTFRGRVVVLAHENEWNTHRYSTPWGQQSYAELLARFFSGAPLRPLPSPIWTVLFVVCLGTLISNFGSWTKIAALVLALASSIICAFQGIRFPIEATLGGLIPLVLYAGPAARSGRPGASSTKAISKVHWTHLCEAAQSFTGCLAAWVFVQKNGLWCEVAQAGDAGILDVELIERLQGSPGSRLPQDRAYTAFPVPNPQEPLGLLVLQPRDTSNPDIEPTDPWRVLSGAMTQTIKAGAKSSSLFQAFTDTTGPVMVFDALGHPVLPNSRFHTEIGLQCRPDSPLAHTWSALGGKASDLYAHRLLSMGIQLNFDGHAIHLQTGIHAGRVECYVLRVVLSSEQPSKASSEESKC